MSGPRASEQMDLFSVRQESAAADATVLTQYLYLAIDWRTHREIARDLGWKDRARARHAAEEADYQVIFGQRGMRHLRHASSEEVANCLSNMSNQRDALNIRIIGTQKRYHSFGGRETAV